MRFEYKYLVEENQLEYLRKRLAPFVVADEFSRNSIIPEYTVRSIYFDTSNLKYYYEKIEGIKRRKKVRIRGYNRFSDENIIFLEVKRKYVNLSKKNRSALKYYNLEELIKSRDIESYILTDNGFSNSLDDAENFLHHIYKRSLKPIVLIVYDREAYLSKFNSSLRLTFDKNLRYLISPSLDKLYSDDKLEHTLANKFIFEVKFSRGFPNWLQTIIRDLDISRRALSKYTICLDDASVFKLHKRRRNFLFDDPFTNIYNGHSLG